MQALAGLLSAGCVIPYVRDILRRTTRPHRVSWFAFALLSTLAAVAQLRAGLGAGAFLSTGAAIGFTAVFLLSLKFGVGGTSTGPRLQLVAITIAAAAWAATDNAAVAIVLVCLIEAAAIVPTVRKAYAEPETETMSTWIIDGVSGAIAAISAVSLAEVAYPLHHLALNSAVALAMVAGRRRTQPAFA